MKIKDIIDKVVAFAPVELAEPWDNVGLMVGAVDVECGGIMVALDLTKDVIKQAVDEKCNLIITHHPFFFSPIKCIDLETSKGEIIAMLIKNGITVYSAHTNLDEAEGGLCQTLATRIGGSNLVADGVGVVCDIKEQSLIDFAKSIAKNLGDFSVKYVGDENRVVRKAFCICGGGASDSAYAHAKQVADVFVSGDFKHHLYVEANNDDFPIVEFSHYHSEIMMTSLIEDVLSNLDVKIVKAKQNCPFMTVGGQYEI